MVSYVVEVGIFFFSRDDTQSYLPLAPNHTCLVSSHFHFLSNAASLAIASCCHGRLDTRNEMHKTSASLASASSRLTATPTPRLVTSRVHGTCQRSQRSAAQPLASWAERFYSTLRRALLAEPLGKKRLTVTGCKKSNMPSSLHFSETRHLHASRQPSAGVCQEFARRIFSFFSRCVVVATLSAMACVAFSHAVRLFTDRFSPATLIIIFRPMVMRSLLMRCAVLRGDRDNSPVSATHACSHLCDDRSFAACIGNRPGR